MQVNIGTDNLFSLIKRLWKHLSRRRQKQFVLLFILMLLSAFAEILSLGSVLPFLGVLLAPEKIYAYPYFNKIMSYLGIANKDQLLFPVTVLFSVLVLIASAIRILLLWVSTRLAYASGADLSIEVYRKTLYQPYQVHIARNSSEVISGITSKVNGVAFGILLSLLTIISSVILLIAITSTMFVINAKVAFMASIGFGLSYLVITFLSRRSLKNNSRRIAQEQTRVLKALQEGLGGIRDVLLDSNQQVYCEIYRQADHPLRIATGNNLFIAQGPRYIMEALGILMIVLLAYNLANLPGGIASAMPILGALALGAQRLLPALQLVYGSWASIVGSHAALVDTLEMLDQPLPEHYHDKNAEVITFEKSIKFENIFFQYNSNSPWVLNNLNFSITKGSRIGLIGTTGSGKSTTLDLLMGLLIPTSGKMIVDDHLITRKNIPYWQKHISHVPQNIYLADTSLAENIAFGVPYNLIDWDRVKKAAQQAQISEFIESKPLGYKAFVGERGVQLSGGQRQRIGIARALYKNSDILVFDEATSALDNATEQSVMSAIEGLNNEYTIILIAHRLTTLRNCHFIIEMENGKIVAIGPYEEMIKRSNSALHISTYE